MKPEEQLLLALGDVGDDLIEESMHLRFPRARWFRALPMAACCALILGAAMLLQNLEPLRESQITLPEGEDTVQEILPPDTEATSPKDDTIEQDALPTEDIQDPLNAAHETLTDYWSDYFKPRGAYVLSLNGGNTGPYLAVDKEGSVLLSIEWGSITPLEDEATGDIVALAVEEWPEGQRAPISNNKIALYSLQGEPLWEVEGTSVNCLGTLLTVRRGDAWYVYRRDNFTLVAGDLYRAKIVGQDLLYTQATEDSPITVYGSDGTVVAEVSGLEESSPYHTWDGHGYISALDKGLVGLLDSSGQWVVEPEYQQIYKLSNGYALCKTENDYRAVSLADGSVAFECAYGICAVYEQGLLLELNEDAFLRGSSDTSGSHNQFVSWDGQILVDTDHISILDEADDGSADLLLLWSEETTDLCRPDGTFIRQVAYEPSNITPVSAQTLLCHRQVYAADGSWRWTMALLHVETGAVTQEFDKAYEYGGSYWRFSNSNFFDCSAHLIAASYRDEAGTPHTDILDEAGNILVSDLHNSTATMPQGDVFTALLDGVPALVRLDGTVLYESDAPA